jgi:hypothetical protein
MARKALLHFVLLIAAVALPCAAVAQDAFSFKVGAGFFSPSESSLKSLYGSGSGWNAEANFRLVSFLDAWIFGDGYSKSGRLPVTSESTAMRLTTFGGGLKARVQAGPIRFYTGVGAAACAYRETNVIGTAQGTGAGFIGQLGFYVPLFAGLVIDLAGDYTSIKVKPEAISANLGGTRLTVRLGYVF